MDRIEERLAKVESELTEIRQKYDTLKQQNAVVRLLGILTLAGIIVTASVGLPKGESVPGVLRGSGLEIVDDKGNLRAALRATADEPSLLLTDDRVRTRLALGYAELGMTKTGERVTRPESSIVLFDRDGKVIYKVPYSLK